MSNRAKLSVGDYWVYEKSFASEKTRTILTYKVIGSEEIGGVKTLIIDWDERLEYGEESLVSGKFWIDEDTDLFVKGERTLYDESGGILEIEPLGKSRLEDWGVKGHARLPESLKMGEKWSFEDSEGLNQVSVVDLKEIKVPAGEFECYLIETKVWKNNLKFTFRSWYSKRLKILAKSIARNPKGVTTGETKLISYLIRKLN